ncbi:MAG: hypothetical protein A2138_11985 [Deltaproteobacteria bacterium RBG_16_71_12]|nr:MAG: hypothetical protein A2138_11985 [Deltaproteobacteria bacterium RBG_16_71_12]
MEPAFRVRFEAPPVARTPAERLLATCDLHEVAIAQITARLRRENPAIIASEIDAAVRRWLAGGDPGPGRPRTWSG